MNGNKKIYGICNVAWMATRVEGTETWYATRKARDAALADLRKHAIVMGLSRTAARAGIYPIAETLAVLRREHDGLHVRCDDSLVDAIV